MWLRNIALIASLSLQGLQRTNTAQNTFFCNFQNNHNTLRNIFFPSQWKLWINSMLYPWPPPLPLPQLPSPFSSVAFRRLTHFYSFSFPNSFFFVVVFLSQGAQEGGRGGRVLLQGPVSKRTTRRVHLHVCSVSALCLRSINNPDRGNCCTVTCHM